MTDILGISAFYHDSAACLLRDGDIIAAAQEERFNRKKHYSGFPSECGNGISQSGVSSLPRPSHADVVAHSPTPSMHRTAAVSNGEG